MSKKKTRSQRQRAARARQDGAAPSAPVSTKRAAAPAGDGMAVYRSLAAPGTVMRLVLILGLALYTTAQAIALASYKTTTNAAAGLALAGTLCISVFLAGGFVRHYRALYRIRRDDPGAWQPTMRFAFASLAVPLGFGGKPADSRERLLRTLTLLLLLAFAITAIAGGRNR